MSIIQISSTRARGRKSREKKKERSRAAFPVFISRKRWVSSFQGEKELEGKGGKEKKKEDGGPEREKKKRRISSTNLRRK